MRNSEIVKRNMFFRQEITPEMQKKWFDSINNKYNGYYIIIYNEKRIGLIHGKDVDFEKRTCEGGIFIWDAEYLNSIVSSLASIIMNDWTFYLGNFKAIYAKVLKENKIALAYNKLQGYESCEPQNDNDGVEWLKLTKENYTKRIDGIRKNMAQFIHDDKPLQLSDLDASDDLGIETEIFYKNLPPDLQALADELITRAKKANP